MSLDISLLRVQETEVFEANITHNLAEMAHEAGIYEAVWRPEEIGIKLAQAVIPILKGGIERMEKDPERYKKYDAENNGWGTYNQFLPWLKKYLEKCKEYPDARICVSR